MSPGLPEPWQLYPMPPEQVAAIEHHITRQIGVALTRERDRICSLLREAAAGRRDYAQRMVGHDPASRDVVNGLALDLECEARQLETVIRLIDGDMSAMTAWLPSWCWTDEMTEGLR